MTLKTTRFDIADELDDEAAIALYLDDALEANDPAYFAHALGTVARARGMPVRAFDTVFSAQPSTTP